MSVPFCFAQVTIPSKVEIDDLSFPRRRESGLQFTPILQLSDSHVFNTLVPKLLFGNAGLHYFDAQDSLRTDTTIRKPVEKKFRMKKSPWVAVGLSALLPGAGQFYNKSYWKVPVILGFVGYLAYEFYDNDKKYRDYRDQYSATQTPENPTGDENLKALRQFYFDQRNDFVWYFTIVYVINLIDAYVDAHLFDFDVREEKLTRFGKTDKEYKLKFKINF